MLLWSKGAPLSKMGNIANRRILYQQFAEEGTEEVSIPAPWTENDQIELSLLRNVTIKMTDTLYGRFLAHQKRDLERAYQQLSAKEKDDFKWKMAEINEAGPDNGRSPPPSLTSI